jgi:hypothetical protein
MARTQNSEEAKYITRKIEKEGWKCIWAFPEKSETEIAIYCRKFR